MIIEIKVGMTAMEGADYAIVMVDQIGVLIRTDMLEPLHRALGKALNYAKEDDHGPTELQ